MSKNLHLGQEKNAQNQSSASLGTHLIDVSFAGIRITTDELANMLNLPRNEALRTRRQTLLEHIQGLHLTLDALEETQTGKPHDTNPHDVVQAVFDGVLYWLFAVEDEVARIEDGLAKEDQ